MKVIIIGGGKLGFYLAKTLQEQKHDVVVVETDRRTCTEVLQGLQGNPYSPAYIAKNPA